MADEIINRVANSKLITVNLEDYYPQGNRVHFDIKDWLFEGFVLREKDFRAQVSEFNWSQYQDAYVALNCSTDAIIPGWAYMLLSIQLQPFAKKTIVGSLENLETSIYQDVINNLDITSFKDKPIIIKGCSKSLYRKTHTLCWRINYNLLQNLLCTVKPALLFRYLKRNKLKFNVTFTQI